MEKEEICLTDQLALVWHKLNCGEWDREALGDMPEGVDPFLVRANAAKAIKKLSEHWRLTEFTTRKF